MRFNYFCILAIFSLLAGPRAIASELEDIYLPARTGVHFGLTVNEVAYTMQSQGFVFGDPAKFDGEQRPVFAMATPHLTLVDLFIAVVPEMGSLDYWNSSNVILGFKNQLLTVMGESEVFRKPEAIQAFHETVAEMNKFFPSQARAGKRLNVPLQELSEILGLNLSEQGVPMPYELAFWIDSEVTTLAGVFAATDADGDTIFGQARYSVLHLATCEYEFLYLQLKDDIVCRPQAPMSSIASDER